MAKKSKSLNPADAFRKAQRAKEIKRNKLDRKKAREEAHTKKDTKGIEAEIRQLENVGKLTTSEQNRLKALKTELAQIRKARESNQGQSSSGPSIGSQSTSASNVIIDPATGLPSTAPPNLASQAQTFEKSQLSGSRGSEASRSDPRTMDWFGPDGKLLEPEKSFYYDPVFNPFGVPPPGMPMRMKPEASDALPSKPVMSTGGPDIQQAENDVGTDLRPSNLATDGKFTHQGEERRTLDKAKDKVEGDDDAADGEEEEDGEDEQDDDDDDDIPLPDGPPPAALSSDEDEDDDIPLPEGPPPVKAPIAPHPQHLINRPPAPQRQPHPGMHPHPPFYPPPISLIPGIPPPLLFNGSGMIPFPMGPNGLPLPPPSFNGFHPLPVAPPSAQLPSRPMAVTNPALQASGSNPAGPNKPLVQTSATLTALPQLRDLKREATSFVPSAIRKKRKELDRRADLAGLGDSNRIQAAPGTGDDPEMLTGDGSSIPVAKPLSTSLLGALKRDGIVIDNPIAKNGTNTSGAAEKDDYDKFVQSLGDVL
ncbi:hypothetical protein CROQUDRAFT_655576 [Cronartium quercuum f. sp. fusiforme G11]|uniref:Wbp11/ELF5/Saf1 N-terminal domain-containing protein n=1 Tax=Cronartium quercuum f. sp. fusiforme G11 TaxID=708437 RepID=A0A9P6NJ55_9BASI|nr:hypothetical protein CROQUDRAFT_655576 [Cronartium quercuum f. sp. fusiforme G11]